MTHRETIKAWLGGMRFSNETIVDWGSGSKPAFMYTKGNDVNWITIDNARGIPDSRKSNHIIHDITTPIITPTADVAFCLEVLEHVEYPEKVLKNIYKNLKSGGALYLSAPFRYELHSDIDYWRFTSPGLILLLERNGFTIDSIESTVDELGYMVEAHK